MAYFPYKNAWNFGKYIGPAIKKFISDPGVSAKRVGDLFGNIGQDIWNEVSGQSAQSEQYAYNSALQEDAQAFNAEEAQKARDWEKMMSDTAFTRQMNDIKNAGYNPYLALGAGNGAAVPSGQAASSSATSVGQRDNKLLNMVPSLIASGVNSARSTNDVLRLLVTAVAAIAAM